jgi:hypothetical protein
VGAAEINDKPKIATVKKFISHSHAADDTRGFGH